MLTKVVNGVTVEMSAEEEAATWQEWAAKLPAMQPPEKKILTDGDLAALLIEKGILTSTEVAAVSGAGKSVP